MSVVADKKQKVTSLQNALAKDLAACDLKWTLFVAAAQTYRYDSRLTPYPSRYAFEPNSSSTEKYDIEAIRRSIEIVPELRSIRWQDLTETVIDLLHWVLCEQSESTIMQSVPKEKFNEVLSKVESDSPVILPTHIIELVPATDSAAELKFQAHLNQDHQSMFAFHGSKIDSFHSITNHGLQQHLCKTALFGNGIYLSSEMHVSASFSQVNTGWKHSALGAQMSCIALCEFIDHPVHLKRHATDDNRGVVPEKYFVITNNDIVRVRYLIVFGQSTQKLNSISRQQQTDASYQPQSRLGRFIAEHKALLTILAYVGLLLLIGLFSSQTGMYIRYIFWTKVEVILEKWMWSQEDPGLIDGVQWSTIRSPAAPEI